MTKTMRKHHEYQEPIEFSCDECGARGAVVFRQDDSDVHLPVDHCPMCGEVFVRDLYDESQEDDYIRLGHGTDEEEAYGDFPHTEGFEDCR